MSGFKMVRPAAITGANLTSNVPETGAPHSVLAAYATGDVVTGVAGDGLTHRFESLVAGNLNNPLTDTTKWLDLGATNRWAMFDGVNGTATEAEDVIDVTVAVSGRVDTLGLLNLVGDEVQVTASIGGVDVYDETHSLVSAENITDWYAYFYEDVVTRPDLVITDLPVLNSPTMRIQVTNANGAAAVGQMVIGHSRTLGEAVYGGASVGMLDFSRKVTDPDFGTASLQPRAYSKRADYKLVMPESIANSVGRLLADYRATNLLWIGSNDHALTIIFGFWKDWGIDFALYGQAHCSLQIEGII